MTAGWQKALDKLDRSLDAAIGETITVVPMVRGDMGARIDNERATFDVIALVAEVEASQEAPARLQTRFVHEQMTVDIQRSALPPGAVVRKYDEIVLVDRPSAPRLIVTRPARLDPGRIVLECGPIED